VDIQLLYPAELTRGLRTRGVQGEYSAPKALNRLLAGTGLTYRIEDGDTLSLVETTTTGMALGPLVVSATRTETPISELTRSVSVVDRAAIAQQMTIDRDIGDILAKQVPGMATSTGGLTNFTQTLRGRDFLVMVDGIPPDPLNNQGGLADTDEWNLLGKLGVDFDSGRQRLELMVNNYDIEQDTDFVTRPGDVAAGQKATAERGEPLGKQTRTENTFASLSYEHRDLLGSAVKLQSYHLDNTASFPIIEFFGTNAGSVNESEKFGTRLTINTPLGARFAGANAIWGVDYLNEENSEIITGDNGFATPTLRDIEQDAIAGFLQLSVPIGEVAQIRAGARHESIDLDIPTIHG